MPRTPTCVPPRIASRRSRNPAPWRRRSRRSAHPPRKRTEYPSGASALGVERLRLVSRSVTFDSDVRRSFRSFPSLQSPRMILENGVIRTMDPTLPTTRALAIAGAHVAGGVGTHELALPGPDVVDLGGRCVLPGFTDSHVHFPTWSLSQREVKLEGVTGLADALERVRAHPRHGSWIRGYGWRSAEWDEQPTAAGTRFRHRRDTRASLLEGLPLGLAQLGGTRTRRGRPAGRRRCRGARRGGSAERDPARGIGLAVPRPSRDADRGRVRGGDARGPANRRRAAAWLRSTTRTAGWARRGSSSASPSVTG